MSVCIAYLYSICKCIVKRVVCVLMFSCKPGEPDKGRQPSQPSQPEPSKPGEGKMYNTSNQTIQHTQLLQ